MNQIIVLSQLHVIMMIGVLVSYWMNAYYMENAILASICTIILLTNNALY